MNNENKRPLEHLSNEELDRLFKLKSRRKGSVAEIIMAEILYRALYTQTKALNKLPDNQ